MIGSELIKLLQGHEADEIRISGINGMDDSQASWSLELSDILIDDGVITIQT